MRTSYKIIVVGDAGVGKSAFLQRHRNGKFEEKYIASKSVLISPLYFQTNYGEILFLTWDCPCQEKIGGLREEHWKGADGVIVMFDWNSNSSCRNVSAWIPAVSSVVPNIPLIICGNKYDSPYRYITNRRDLPNVKYYEVSAMSGYNLDKPFLDLARKLTRHEDLEFEEVPAICPPEVNVNCSPCPQNKVNWVEIPGGMMKVTYELYPYVRNWSDGIEYITDRKR